MKNLSLLHSSSKSSFMSMCCMISVACPDCWSPDLEIVISCLPQWEYMAVARKLSEWTQADRTRQSSVLESVVANFPSDLRSTSFGIYFPRFLQAVCRPKGSNFHPRMHNSNGKKVIENVILVSLGKCKPMSMVYSNIMKCANKYFQVDVTTHI